MAMKVSTYVALKFIVHNTDGCDRFQALGTLHRAFWVHAPALRMLLHHLKDYNDQG